MLRLYDTVFVPDGKAQIVTPWAPIGAKNPSLIILRQITSFIIDQAATSCDENVSGCQ